MASLEFKWFGAFIDQLRRLAVACQSEDRVEHGVCRYRITRETTLRSISNGAPPRRCDNRAPALTRKG
jgi:hypothetical protein